MKLLILGAGGIIGQFLRASTPPNVEATFCRWTPLSPGYTTFNAANVSVVNEEIESLNPEVIINLAGESNTDKVEFYPRAYRDINVGLPETLADMPDNIRLIHISSQAVFNGFNPPYSPISMMNPINVYGRQKHEAERLVRRRGNVNIIRPTFVLGVRPDPTIGRQNPIEAMLSGQRKQVSDRYFSVSFAPDVAHCIWQAALHPDSRRIIHAGIPYRTSRYQIACDLGLDVEPVSHDDFPGLAPRPVDTTYAEGEYRIGYAEGLAACRAAWEAREGVAA